MWENPYFWDIVNRDWNKDYSHSQGCKRVDLYLGLKQLETDWKPTVILVKRSSRIQNKNPFLTQATKRHVKVTSLQSERLPLQETWKYIIKHEQSKVCA